MKLLLHICCAPCSIYPLDVLRNARHDVMGFFYRYNIHPFTECLRREEALKAYAQAIDLKVIYQSGYELETFLRNVAFREAERCTYCYHDRLTSTAHVAKKGKFDAFSTTLLYSRFQNHDLIRSIGEAWARRSACPSTTRISGTAGGQASTPPSGWACIASNTAAASTVKRRAIITRPRGAPPCRVSIRRASPPKKIHRQDYAKSCSEISSISSSPC
ncbi:epoxyqueuosine reductase QueH [Desulfosarcina cetonica]|uniref:epoxyqueuosine reductase QueH n=1 Tax=Desulfosarcina cetonica TaxID=90730 RepID=UPI000B30A4F5